MNAGRAKGMIRMLRNILSNTKKEPLAAIAIILTIILSVLQSEWLNAWLSPSVEIEAYYSTQTDGRCSLVAFSIDNKTNNIASDIRVNIVTDWIARSGKEPLALYDRNTGLIGAEASTPIGFREVLDVKYSTEGDTLEVPVLLPGEYLDLFLGRMIDPAFAEARQQLSESDRYKFTPRIGTASYASGRLSIRNHGDCVHEFE
jgi:hypothetical protein